MTQARLWLPVTSWAPSGQIQTTHQNELKQGALVHFEELLVPHGNVIRPLLLVLVVFRGRGVVFVMSAPLNDLRETVTMSIKHACALEKP